MINLLAVSSNSKEVSSALAIKGVKTWKCVVACATTICIATVLYVGLAPRYTSIQVDLGRNIQETATMAGGARFTSRNVAGLVRFSINNLPTDLPVLFTRPGLEARFDSLFAVSLYADEEDNNDLKVGIVVLQFSNDQVTDHRSGQAFVTALIKKFSTKKWIRFIPDVCPAVTGRSNFIQADGKIALFEACPLDPDYTMTLTEWRTLALKGLSFEWVGDGLMATLNVKGTEDSRGVTYRASIEYEDETVRARHHAKNLAEELSRGDQQGWNSTAKHEKNHQIMLRNAKAAEIAAVDRGDKIVPRRREATGASRTDPANHSAELENPGQPSRLSR